MVNKGVEDGQWGGGGCLAERAEWARDFVRIQQLKLDQERNAKELITLSVLPHHSLSCA